MHSFNVLFCAGLVQVGAILESAACFSFQLPGKTVFFHHLSVCGSWSSALAKHVGWVLKTGSGDGRASSRLR